MEVAGLFPELVPLTHKAGYPSDGPGLEQRVLKRLGITRKEAILREMRFKSIMLFSNPFLYETHMQVMSDALISKEGLIGTVRDPSEP